VIRVSATAENQDGQHGLEKILEQGRKPNRLQANQGKEFFSQTFQRFLNKQAIQQFSMHGEANVFSAISLQPDKSYPLTRYTSWT